jgi:hypothetical protein
MRANTTTICLAVVYGIVCGTLLIFLFSSMTATHESFVVTAPIKEALCMKCMEYFRDVLQFSDTTKIVPYIRQRSEYLMFVIGQFVDFVENNLGRCPKKGDTVTVSDALACFPSVMEKLMVDCVESGANRADCVIISALGDKIMNTANQCGADLCSLEMFRQRFMESINTMREEIQACRATFATDESVCTKLYAQIILAKTRPSDPLENALLQREQDARPITREELRQELGKQTAFMMNEIS